MVRCTQFCGLFGLILSFNVLKRIHCVSEAVCGPIFRTSSSPCFRDVDWPLVLDPTEYVFVTWARDQRLIPKRGAFIVEHIFTIRYKMHNQRRGSIMLIGLAYVACELHIRWQYARAPDDGQFGPKHSAIICIIHVVINEVCGLCFRIFVYITHQDATSKTYLRTLKC
jgi:hypothetical protein